MTTLSLDDVTLFGTGLKRPECVACTASGAIWVSHAPADGARGVARLDPEGGLHPLVARSGAPDDFTPNGWSIAPDGSFLVANLGESGGAWRLRPDGVCEPLLLSVDGHALPSVNFVHRAEDGVLWISVSTWRAPRDRAFHRDVADGFVIRMPDPADPASASIAADGLGYANEVKIDPSGAWLYANETMARRLSRWRLTDRGLGRRETVAEYGDGVFPDGFEFDAEGGIWCASVMSNRVVRVGPDGTQAVVLEDCDPTAVAAAMANWRDGTFTRADMNVGAGRRLANIASITFGGPDRRTAYLGSLAGGSLATFRSPVAGAEPPHWHF